MIKRRNLDYSKLRKSLRRSRLIESLNTSTTAYLKVIVIWIFVLFANHLAGFHFEYMWPVWLMVCSVYDSFKYQGLAFSAFFVGVTVTSDMLCYFLIPIQWLFFSASTFVWVQYVYQTERAITLPTIGLWFMFVTFEASLRIQGIKSLPFHIDLCRPFATHCIGYPMVTLGFGVKSYISYKIRVRRQRETERDNAFLYDLVDLALPEECRLQSRGVENASNAPESLDDLRRNGRLVREPPHDSDTSSKASSDTHESRINGAVSEASNLPTASNGKSRGGLPRPNSGFLQSSGLLSNNNSAKGGSRGGKSSHSSHQNSSSSNSSSAATADSLQSNPSTLSNVQNGHTATMPVAPVPAPSVESVGRLEAELRRLRGEIQTFRSLEIELKAQIAVHSTNDRMLKSELSQVKQENETIQSRLQSTVNSREQQYKAVQALEKRLTEEKKQKAFVEQQLAAERKLAAKLKSEQQEKREEKKQMAVPSSPVTHQNGGNSHRSSGGIFDGQCSEQCKLRRREIENELSHHKREIRSKDELLSRNNEHLESIQIHLNQLKERNERLENDLAAESKLKLRLLTALSETKKVVDQQQGLLDTRDRENQMLQEKLREFVSNLYPPTSTVHPASVAAATQNVSQAAIQSASQLQAAAQGIPGSHPFIWNAIDTDLVGAAPNAEQLMFNTN